MFMACEELDSHICECLDLEGTQGKVSSAMWLKGPSKECKEKLWYGKGGGIPKSGGGEGGGGG